MPPVPRGFPHELDAGELDNAIADLAARVDNWPREVLPELELALLNAGLQERARREIADLGEVSRQAAAAADRAAEHTLTVAYLTLGVAAITLIVAVLQWVYG